MVRHRVSDLARLAVPPDGRRRRARHRRLHVAGAGSRARRRLPRRPVHARRDPVRARDRAAGVPEGDGRPDPRRDHRGLARADREPQPERSRARAVADRGPLPRQGPGRALRLDARPRARPAPAPRAPRRGRRLDAGAHGRDDGHEAPSPAAAELDRARPRRSGRRRAVGRLAPRGARATSRGPRPASRREAHRGAPLRGTLRPPGGPRDRHRARPPADGAPRPARAVRHHPVRRAGEQRPAVRGPQRA